MPTLTPTFPKLAVIENKHAHDIVAEGGALVARVDAHLDQAWPTAVLFAAAPRLLSLVDDVANDLSTLNRPDPEQLALLQRARSIIQEIHAASTPLADAPPQPKS